MGEEAVRDGGRATTGEPSSLSDSVGVRVKEGKRRCATVVAPQPASQARPEQGWGLTGTWGWNAGMGIEAGICVMAWICVILITNLLFYE